MQPRYLSWLETRKDGNLLRSRTTIPDFSETFSIHFDASDVGLGAVICHGSDGLPIAFASDKFKGPGIKIFGNLSVVFAVQKFRPCIERYHFKIYTDHCSLIWLFKQETSPASSGYHRKALIYITEKYRPGHTVTTANVCVIVDDRIQSLTRRFLRLYCTTSGHLDEKRTRFYWPGASKDADVYAKSCEICESP